MLDAATAGDRREQIRAAMAQGSSKSRGAFSTALDALTSLLHERVRDSADGPDPRRARSAAQALEIVEDAKEQATGNGNPQLVTSELLRRLERVLV
jgi:hypothetical protein